MAGLLLVAWTLLVWAGRLRNIAVDAGDPAEYVVPVGLLALALWALADGRRRRRATLLLAAATAAVWLVRVPLILARDHGAAFKVVHVVLAVVSLGLAAYAVSTGRSSVPTVGGSLRRPRRSS